MSVNLKRNANEGGALMGEYPNGLAPLFNGFKNSLILEDFEHESMPIARPLLPPPTGDLWEEVGASSDGTPRPTEATLIATDQLYGAKSLQVRRLATADTPELFQLRYINNLTGESATNNWHWLREVVTGWQENKINRLRFWVKFPAGMSLNISGNNNFHFGTYLRSNDTARTENESGGQHYYHYFNIKREGSLWHQVIIDNHPNHKRGNNGNTELAAINEPMPSTDPARNYFDTMTYFYLQPNNVTEPAMPADFLFDSFEMYEDPYDEDVEQIYGLSGIYNDETDEIVLRWNRDKTTSALTFDVRFAFSSFHKNGGFTHGSAAPNGTGLQSVQWDFEPTGYNGVEYRESGFNFAGQDHVFIAIKHQNSPTRFREIQIPLNASGYPTVGGQ